MNIDLFELISSSITLLSIKKKRVLAFSRMMPMSLICQYLQLALNCPSGDVCQPVGSLMLLNGALIRDTDV